MKGNRNRKRRKRGERIVHPFELYNSFMNPAETEFKGRLYAAIRDYSEMLKTYTGLKMKVDALEALARGFHPESLPDSLNAQKDERYKADRETVKLCAESLPGKKTEIEALLKSSFLESNQDIKQIIKMRIFQGKTWPEISQTISPRAGKHYAWDRYNRYFKEQKAADRMG